MSIFAARNKDSGLYTNRVINFLMGEHFWMESQKPSVSQVKEQIDFINSRRSIWCNNINEAEVWSEDTIKTYGQYLDNVEFVPITLGTE